MVEREAEEHAAQDLLFFNDDGCGSHSRSETDTVVLQPGGGQRQTLPRVT
jgi:hypothetical protein